MTDTKPDAAPTPRTGDWWCPECKEALPWNHVTFYERCDTCGTPVTVAGEGDVARLERELAAANKSTLFYIEERAHYKTRAEAAEHLLQRALIALNEHWSDSTEQVCNEIKAALAEGNKHD